MKFKISMIEYFSENYLSKFMSFRISLGGVIRSDRAKSPVKISTTNLKDKTRVGGRYTNKRIKL